MAKKIIAPNGIGLNDSGGLTAQTMKEAQHIIKGTDGQRWHYTRHFVLARVTGSSFHKCYYEEQEKRKQFFREGFKS